MFDLFGDNATLGPTQPIMPESLMRLLNAVSMDIFDPMIGYGYALSFVSALVQGKCELQISNSFHTELSLYFLIMAPSASGKGSLCKHLYAPIGDAVAAKRDQDRIQNEERKVHNTAIDQILSEKRKQARKSGGARLRVLMQELAELEKEKLPLLPEFVFDAQDVTPAALLKLLAEQETHSLLICDTEGRFIRSIDENKFLAAMLNQTFVGEPVSDSRASTKSIRVDSPHLSIVTAIQPDKCKKLIRNQNLWGEGFMARVVPYFSMPPINKDSGIEEIKDQGILTWWRDKIKYLFDLPHRKDSQGHTQPYAFGLTEEAYSLLEAHIHALQNMKAMPQNMGILPNLARLHEITARIAVIYHIVEQQNPIDVPVSGNMMQLAINASMFFLVHVQRLWSEFNPDPMWVLLPKICGWLKSRIGTSEYVTAKEIYGGIGGNKTGFMRALQWLRGQGIIIPATAFDPTPHFGCWSTVKNYGFVINQQVLSNYPD